MPRKYCKFFVANDAKKHENCELWKEIKTISEKLLELAKEANSAVDFRKYDPKLQRGRDHDEPEAANKNYNDIDKENELLRKLIQTWNAEYDAQESDPSPQDDSVICFDDFRHGVIVTSTRMEEDTSAPSSFSSSSSSSSMIDYISH